MTLKLKTVSNYSYNPRRDGISQSILATFLTCPEKAKLAVLEGLTPIKTSQALSFGSLFHASQDALFKLVQNGDTRPPAALVADALEETEAIEKAKLRSALVSEDIIQAFALDFGQVRLVLQAYVDYWPGDFTEVEWVALEETFEMPLKIDGETVIMRGKRDGLFRARTKKLYLKESKTRAQINSEGTGRSLGMNLQNMVYLASVEHDYKEFPAGVMYDEIRRPQLRQGKAENVQQFLARIAADIPSRPDFYFVRWNANFLKRDITKFKEQDLTNIVRRFLRWFDHPETEHFHDGSQCNGRYGICPFLGVCEVNDRKGFYTKTSPFMELVEEAKTE